LVAKFPNLKTILLLAVLIMSCKSQTTEQKLKSAVESIERARIKKAGETIESLSIDSLHFSQSSDKELSEYAKIDDNIIMDDSTLLNFRSIHNFADTTNTLFNVSYFVRARTDKNSYNTWHRVFLNNKDLSVAAFNIRKYFKN
jgi:hypothetical protein